MTGKTELFDGSHTARGLFFRKSQIEFAKRRGEQMPAAKLTEADVRAIRQMIAAGEAIRDVAKKHGVSHTTIGRVVRRESWRHV